MDDLKIVLYIVVAIIWVVYNNYKKISDASKKRDPSKPPGEIIQENWPGKKPETIPPVFRKLKEVAGKQTSGSERNVAERIPLPSRSPLKQKIQRRRQVTEQPVNLVPEGGMIAPSKVVHFQEIPADQDTVHPMFLAIKNMDLRSAFVMSEVLKRPYN